MPATSAMRILLIVNAEVENPMLILIMGCVGFVLNIVSVLFLHGITVLYDLKESSAKVR